ncbi:hypothetical protein I552_1778 [Mycobacterium xenopi 3993]|nr:hypothetical protein I552_1778 [Mycobacterium xenopi 3993]
MLSPDTHVRRCWRTPRRRRARHRRSAALGRRTTQATP